MLVTGGAGFIGSNFIHYWLAQHPADEVVNFDALTYAGNLENLASIHDNPRYHFIKGDICDAAAVDAALDGVETIVHFAAESHVDRSILDSAAFARTNVLGTLTLLEAARQHGNLRFHHVSTDEVFGALGPHDPPFTETTPYDPRSPYSASKAASDHLVRAYYHTHGLPITISNCSNNYGPYQFPEKLIPLFVTNLLEGKKVPVYGDGQQVRDWIHVDDHNRGVETILQKGETGQTYCLGGKSEKTNLEITQLILARLGKGAEMIEHVADRPGHDRRYAMDFTKAKTELGWDPQVRFEDGVASTIDWYLNHEGWWRNVKSGAYQEYYERQYGNR